MKNQTILLAVLFVGVASIASYTAIDAAVNWAIPMPESTAEIPRKTESGKPAVELDSSTETLSHDGFIVSADISGKPRESSKIKWDPPHEQILETADRFCFRWDDAVQVGKTGAVFMQWQNHDAKPDASGELTFDGPRYILMGRQNIPIYCKHEPIVTKQGDEWVITFGPDSADTE